MDTNATMRRADEPGVDRLLTVDGTSVLVTGGAGTHRATLLRELASTARERGRDVVVVTATRGYDRLERDLPDGVAVVDCTPSETPDGDDVVGVGSPGDLTGTSIPVSRFLDAAGPEPLVVVDSLSTLLVYADEEPVFRFIRTLSDQVRSVGGTIAVGMNAESHDERTLRTFQQVFEGHARIGDRGVDVRGI